MPLTLLVTEGVIPKNGHQETVAKLSETFLKLHGLTGNKFMTPNVIGHLVVSPESQSYAGGKPQSLAIVEVKVPAVAFQTAEVKRAFVGEITDIIDQLKAGSHPRERTFVNVTYAVDGTWGIAGKAYSNAEMGEAIQHGAS